MTEVYVDHDYPNIRQSNVVWFKVDGVCYSLSFTHYPGVPIKVYVSFEIECDDEFFWRLV
jgi:hypothetical protein